MYYIVRPPAGNRAVAVSRKWVIVSAVVIGLGIGGLYSWRIIKQPIARPLPSVPTKYTVLSLNKSMLIQSRRLEKIHKLIDRGVFAKVEMRGTIPRVRVAEQFYALEFDQQQAFIGVVYAYYLDGSDKFASVLLFDNVTGQEVGSYSIAQGGLKIY